MTWIEVYGPWIGLGLIVLFNWVLPFLRDKWFPARMKAEEDERLWLRNMFAAQVEALRAIEKNLVQINADNSSIRDAEETIVNNQQIIMGKQDMHHNEMMSAVSAMRERTARIDGITEGKKLPRTGPIGSPNDKPA